jgi:WD40 repeat protein
LAGLYLKSERAYREVERAYSEVNRLQVAAKTFHISTAVVSAAAHSEGELSAGNWKLAGLLAEQAYLMRDTLAGDSPATPRNAQYVTSVLRRVLHSVQFSKAVTIPGPLPPTFFRTSPSAMEIGALALFQNGLYFWDLRDLRRRFVPLWFSGAFSDADLSADGMRLAITRDPAVSLSPPQKPLTLPPAPSLELIIFDTGQKRWRSLGNAGSGNLSSVRWSPDGKRIAVSSQAAVRVWDVETGRMTQAFAQNPLCALAESIAWSPDSQRLAVTLTTCGAYSPGNAPVKLLAVGDHVESKLKGIPTSPPTALPLPAVPPTPYGRFQAIDWSRNGILSACTPSGQLIWKALDQPARKIAEGCSKLAFSPDGEQMADTGSTGIDLRDVNAPNRPAETLLPGEASGQSLINSIQDFIWSPDGQQIAGIEASFGIKQSTLHIWPLSEKLDSAICEHVQRNLSKDEWNTYFGAEFPYERTCRNFVSGVGAPANAPFAGDVGDRQHR